MPDLWLHAGNEQFTGWKSINITRSIEQGSNRFEVAVKTNAPLPLAEGMPVQFTYAGQTVHTGYIDDLVDDYDATRWDQSITGRSRMADIIDCSTEGKTFAAGQTLYPIADELLRPFGIAVEVFTQLVPFKADHPLAAGRALWEFLDELARYAGVLLYSSANGNLVVARAGAQRSSTALVLGENVRGARATRSASQRFGEYIVIGNGDMAVQWDVKKITGQRGVARDMAVQRHRPVVIPSDHATDKQGCEQQALWQRNRNYGRSRPVTYVVGDWLDGNGVLWEPNTLVPVVDPRLGIDEERLVTTVHYVVDEDGKRAELTVQPPAAFDLVPLPEPDAATGWGA